VKEKPSLLFETVFLIRINSSEVIRSTVMALTRTDRP